MTDLRVEEKVALVTGAGRQRGIGRAIALELAEQGAAVVVHAMPRAEHERPQHEQEAQWHGAASVVEEIVALGGRAIAVEADLTDRAAPQRIAEEAAAQLGPITLLVNNAATAGSTGGDTLLDVDDDEWVRTVDVNLTSVYRCCRAVLPGMLEAGGGAIINISSLAGLRARPYFGAYSASKFGVVGLTQQLALEFAPTVRVNCVCPGTTDTDMMDSTWERNDERTSSPAGTTKAKVIRAMPLRRQGRPEDIAAAVAFFASDAAAFVTGQILSVDGGQDLR